MMKNVPCLVPISSHKKLMRTRTIITTKPQCLLGGCLLPRARLASDQRRLTRLLLLLGLCALESPARAQDNPQSTEPQNTPAASPKPSAGLLPVPDYSADIWTRKFLTGDWGGVRTDLANKGVQFGVEWSQYVQGVADGGRDRTTLYGGNFDYTLNLDLMRMGVLQGALVRFRAESRYGRSVNSASGTVLPINTDAFFPLTDQLDKDV